MENVGDDVDGLGDVLAEALRIVHRLLARGIRIEVSAEILHLELEGVLGATACALESHVLEEVGGAVGRVRLGARTSVYPHTDGRSLGMGVGLRRDGESVREGGDFRERALRDCCRQRPPKYLPAHAREIFIMRIFGRKSKRYDSRDSALRHAASERAS